MTVRSLISYIMYYIYGQSGPSLLIESTDSMIAIAIQRTPVYHCSVYHCSYLPKLPNSTAIPVRSGLPHIMPCMSLVSIILIGASLSEAHMMRCMGILSVCHAVCTYVHIPYILVF